MTEAGEETLAEYANQITDMLIMGDLSEYQQNLQAFKEQGLSEKEAIQKASMQAFVINPLIAAAGGALSGGVMGAGAAL